MTIWNLHFLNARNQLTRHMADIRATAREAVERASEFATVPRFDLVVKCHPASTIPEWGVGGFAPVPGMIEISINPERFDRDYLLRSLIHEMHHLIRWDGPGYGRSLGEALVSEGLAGHFVLQVLGGEPDPWDSLRISQGWARQAMNEWSRLDYDHARWFFGKGDLRKWAGYGLGHRLVGDYLTQHPDASAAGLAEAPADLFRPTMRALLGADAEIEDDPSEAAEVEVIVAEEAAAVPEETPVAEEPVQKPD